MPMTFERVNSNKPSPKSVQESNHKMYVYIQENKTVDTGAHKLTK